MHVLLNWVWQGIAVALVAAAVLKIVPRSRTRTRYAIAWSACIAVLALPAVPLLLAAFATVPATDVATISPAARAAVMPAAPVEIPSVWWTTVSAALAAWSLWAVLSSCRTAAALLAVGRARRHARSFPPGVERRLAQWPRLRTTGRSARLALSEEVATAGVLGGRVPVIAIAPVLLDRLDVRDLDRVIAHEWAHVQRRDDLAQLCVRAVHAVAGWHPAIWWLERQLHVEREVACDEMAIAATGCARTYATCLTTLAAIPAGRPRVPALAAISSSGLRERVVRIVGAGGDAAPLAPRLTLFAGAAAVTVAALLIGQVPIVGRIAPAIARAAIADRPLAPTFQAPAAVAVASAPAVRRANTTRRPDPLAVQPERQQNREMDSVVTDTSPPLAAGPVAAAAAFALPAAIAGAAPVSTPSSALAPPADFDLASPTQEPAWGRAVDAGKAIGARSEQAAVAAAGFFTRVGKQVARSF